MKHVISIGGGLSSTMALPRRVIERYGRESVVCVMARLPNEDPDVWRLVEAVEADLRIRVEMIGLELTPWDVFFREGMMGSSRVDPCSRVLKREVLAKYMQDNHDSSDTVLHVGITYHEIDRMGAIRRNWTKQGWWVEALLADDPTVTRESLMAECQARYGFVPRLYQLGMSHNNCGGACVKAGHKEWARLLWYSPDVYEWWEYNEIKFRSGDYEWEPPLTLKDGSIIPESIRDYMRQSHKKGTTATILRDRRGGITTSLSLVDFRRRMEARWRSLLPGIDPFEGLDPTPACAFCEAA